MDQTYPESGSKDQATKKDYLNLSEQEKDEEITRAIIRLQNRIRSILFHDDQQTSEQRSRKGQDRSTEDNDHTRAAHPTENHEN